MPAHLIVNLGPQDEAGEVDLLAERYDVRQSARRNTFTGKTYNSVENISQFFGERGMPFNGPPSRPPSRSRRRSRFRVRASPARRSPSRCRR